MLKIPIKNRMIMILTIIFFVDAIRLTEPKIIKWCINILHMNDY